MRIYNPPDPFSFGNTAKMQKIIQDRKDELRRDKLKEELKDEKAIKEIRADR